MSLILSKLFSLLISSSSFSLNETVKIIKLNKITKIWKKIDMFPRKILEYANAITMKVDLKKTWYLKTAIIENEWINNLKNDILDGPK